MKFQDKWSSAYDVRTILLSIQSLLGGMRFSLCILLNLFKHVQPVVSVFDVLHCTSHEFNLEIVDSEPNNDSPLNSYAAALWADQEGASYRLASL